jgi:hypothetical protein
VSSNYYFTRDVKRVPRKVFTIGNTKDTPLQIASGEDGELVDVAATGPVFVGKKQKLKVTMGEGFPKAGEDVLTAWRAKHLN